MSGVRPAGHGATATLNALALPLVGAALEIARASKVEEEVLLRNAAQAAFVAVINQFTASGEHKAEVKEIIQAMAVSLASLVAQVGAQPVEASFEFHSQFFKAHAAITALFTPKSDTKQ